MDLSKLLRLPSDGWRKTAVINTSVVGFFAIANLSTLIWSLTKSGLYENNTFRADDCSKVSLLNTFLHLLLNIASSLIIASSNFFMQVLNSPTRAEVDQAHACKRWFEIGVPSLRNVLNVSPYKSLVWVLFSLSSLPIHLLFNSAIFSVDYSGSAWSMALVSESFLNGAPYSFPGAALVLEGTSCQELSGLPGRKIYSYGNGDYRTDSEAGSDFYDSSQRLSAVLGAATQRLSVSDYFQGWVVENIYNMWDAFGDVYDSRVSPDIDNEFSWDHFSSIWEPFLGSSWDRQPNSLWFSSGCYKTTDPTSSNGCYNTCGNSLGRADSIHEPINDKQGATSTWEYSWWHVNGSNSTWGPPWGPNNNSNTARQWAQGYFDDLGSWPYWCTGLPRPSYSNNLANDIRVKYCLAEPFEPGCELGISNLLLLVVTICVFIKLLLCIIVVAALRDDPLVTPGDAVASFIRIPDSTTIGRCAATTPDIRFGLSNRTPNQWQQRLNSFGIHDETRTRWLSRIGCNILNGGVLKASWFPKGNFVASVMLPNIPQLILSCAYFTYNALYTRLLTESEWQSFSMSYRPLRVTHPQGEQWSTFRLQLPYRYSIPLLITSILLHWITSNAIFLFMSKGVLLPLLLGLTSLRGSMIISRSNSLIISAACHVSTIRNFHSPSSWSKSTTRDENGYDDNPGPVDNTGDWSRNTTAVISAILEESLELQPLVSESCRCSPISGCSTTQSEHIHSDVPAENIPNIEARASPENNPIIKDQATQHLLAPHPAYRSSGHSTNLDGNSTTASEDSWYVEEQPLSSAWSTRESITTNHLRQNSNAASDDSKVTAASAVVAQGDVDAESRRLSTSPRAAGDHGGDTASYLEPGSTDDRLAAARRLEDGTDTEEDDMQFRTRLSKSRIRWGVVRMPDEFYAQFGDMEEGVELRHLSFATEEQGVVPPVDDHWHMYA
ncbi:hypothetical protein J7T55_007212 [Diaporthe amygdali]|uniref:uncharacterized protein n=1 Tax=Phomopsis amygdali TaxID=1214568 RepID=UPI0022FDBE67|nr:uncharacterized protein J7T55_007212 [Diaporthe amygdali]KAJ0108093.1 hypothetical protein J7T55_007212 [Diaporthe amygdali]